jgi:hypothetical protein
MGKKTPINKETILDFLKENVNQKFTINQLNTALQERYGTVFSVNYPLVARHIDVLIAQNQLKVMNVGKIRVVWLD